MLITISVLHSWRMTITTFYVICYHNNLLVISSLFWKSSSATWTFLELNIYLEIHILLVEMKPPVARASYCHLHQHHLQPGFIYSWALYLFSWLIPTLLCQRHPGFARDGPMAAKPTANAQLNLSCIIRFWISKAFLRFPIQKKNCSQIRIPGLLYSKGTECRSDGQL